MKLKYIYCIYSKECQIVGGLVLRKHSKYGQQVLVLVFHNIEVLVLVLMTQKCHMYIVYVYVYVSYEGLPVQHVF